MKNLKNIILRCQFSCENWQFLNKKAEELEISVSAVLRQIISSVFENRQYLQDIVYDAEKYKTTSLTVSSSSFKKLVNIVHERNQHCTTMYYADYVVSAYIQLIEAEKMR